MYICIYTIESNTNICICISNPSRFIQTQLFIVLVDLCFYKAREKENQKKIGQKEI